MDYLEYFETRMPDVRSRAMFLTVQDDVLLQSNKTLRQSAQACFVTLRKRLHVW